MFALLASAGVGQQVVPADATAQGNGPQTVFGGIISCTPDIFVQVSLKLNFWQLSDGA